MLYKKDIFERIELEGNRSEFELNGFHCVILRLDAFNNPEDFCMYHLSGFVVLSDDHPMYHCHHEDLPVESFSVFGGINYSADHIDSIDIGENRWVLGFMCCGPDCSVTKEELIRYPEKYKNMEFVKRELRALTAQLKNMQDAS